MPSGAPSAAFQVGWHSTEAIQNLVSHVLKKVFPSSPFLLEKINGLTASLSHVWHSSAKVFIVSHCQNNSVGATVLTAPAPGLSLSIGGNVTGTRAEERSCTALRQEWFHLFVLNEHCGAHNSWVISLFSSSVQHDIASENFLGAAFAVISCWGWDLPSQQQLLGVERDVLGWESFCTKASHVLWGSAGSERCRSSVGSRELKALQLIPSFHTRWGRAAGSHEINGSEAKHGWFVVLCWCCSYRCVCCWSSERSEGAGSWPGPVHQRENFPSTIQRGEPQKCTVQCVVHICIHVLSFTLHISELEGERFSISWLSQSL